MNTSNWTPPGDDFLRLFLDRPELSLVSESCTHECALHNALRQSPTRKMAPEDLSAIADADARDNYAMFIGFRDRLLGGGTLETCYLQLIRGGATGVPTAFIDLVLQGIVNQVLRESRNVYALRAGEMLWRAQRISTQDGQILAMDSDAIDRVQARSDLGEMGRLLQESGASVRQATIAVLNDDNAPQYWDAVRSGSVTRPAFALDLSHELSNTFGHGVTFTLANARSGLKALAQVLELWVAHFLGFEVRISPQREISDTAWRWHLGLDVQSSAILNDLYEERTVEPERLARMLSLFRLDFADARDMRADIAGKPVYLGLAMNDENLLRIKPQNLLLNLPQASLQ